LPVSEEEADKAMGFSGYVIAEALNGGDKTLVCALVGDALEAEGGAKTGRVRRGFNDHTDTGVRD
jgi:hypothetical protein